MRWESVERREELGRREVLVYVLADGALLI